VHAGEVSGDSALSYKVVEARVVPRQARARPWAPHVCAHMRDARAASTHMTGGGGGRTQWRHEPSLWCRHDEAALPW